MQIAEILRGKGSDVTTVDPATPVAGLLLLLAQHNIGAVVVAEGGQVVGIASERDVVRRLNEHGAALLEAPVREIMTAAVVTCVPEDTVDEITVLMTEHRFRHLPVLQDGELAGIVSIGDIVKSRISQLEAHREQLENYITQG